MKEDCFVTIFDLDHTLLKVNSSYSFGAFLYRNKQISLVKGILLVFFYGLHKVNLISVSILHRLIFRILFYKKPVSFFKPFLDKYLNQELSGHFFPPVVQRLEEAKNKGDLVAILSSSPDFLVEAIAKFFKVDVWAATTYELDQDHCFSEVAKVMEGEDKAVYLKALLSRFGIPKEYTSAYSDSHLDLPLLNAVAFPVAVNPDKKLRRICQQQDWPIIDWISVC